MINCILYSCLYMYRYRFVYTEYISVFTLLYNTSHPVREVCVFPTNTVTIIWYQSRRLQP